MIEPYTPFHLTKSDLYNLKETADRVYDGCIEQDDSKTGRIDME